MKISTINRFFNILLGSLAMVAVAILSAYLSMRVAIHGREVEVPPLASLSVAEAGKKANALGLRLKVENRFYSAIVPAGSVIAQSPAPGATVRRAWTVRITESLGAQQVSIPALTGESERPATLAIRRISLELGVLAHLPAPGPSGIVLGQTPTPGATGVDSPRISLLLSVAPDPASTPTLQADAAGSSSAFVMPSVIGLTMATAASRIYTAGLRVSSAEDLNSPKPVTVAQAPGTASPGAPATATPAAPSLAPSPPAAPAVAYDTPSTRTVAAQSPAAGHRVTPGDAVKIYLTY